MKTDLLNVLRWHTDGKKMPFTVHNNENRITLVGRDWSLLFAINNHFRWSELEIVGEPRFYGSEDQFAEDFILAKMLLT